MRTVALLTRWIPSGLRMGKGGGKRRQELATLEHPEGAGLLLEAFGLDWGLGGSPFIESRDWVLALKTITSLLSKNHN